MFFLINKPARGVPVIILVLAAIKCTVVGFSIRSRRCSYEAPKIDDVVLHVRQNEEENNCSYRGVRSAADRKNLRIYIYYDDKSIEGLPNSEQRAYVRQDLVPGAVRFWQGALSLRHPSDIRLRLNRKCSTPKYFLHTTTRQQSCFGGCRAVTKCGEVIVPDEHLNQCHSCSTNDTKSCDFNGPENGPGVEGADFILYVSAVHTDRCFSRDTVAYAAHCQQEDTLDRPIAGHVNLCPESVSVQEKDQEVLISTVKHEILHALGFSAGLFAFFRDDNGLPLTQRNEVGKPVSLNNDRTYYEWSDRVAKRITRSDWWTRSGRMEHNVHMVVTPRVQKEARRHFACDSLEGAELENQGAEGTAYTHWEKRVFENEAMTGTHTQSPAYSRLTLALMEDSGWYVANYSMAEPLVWGAELGCEFATKSCGEWITSRQRAKLSIVPFCTQLRSSSLSSSRQERSQSDSRTTCTMTRRSVGLCNMREYRRDAREKIPPEYQYFDSGNPKSIAIGGSVMLADYCPYPQEFEWNNTNDNEPGRDSRCTLSDNMPEPANNAALESYGPQSMCFDHYGSWTLQKCRYKRTVERSGAGCHQYECKDGLLRIRVQLENSTSSSYICYKTGQVIRIRRIVNGWLHEGAIVCPPCQEICEKGEESFECLPDTDVNTEDIDDPKLAVPCRAIRARGYYNFGLFPILMVLLATFFHFLLGQPPTQALCVI